MGGKYTEAQKRATAKYKLNHRDKITLDFPKGSKDKYKAYAQSKGVSLTKLICDLVEKDMKAAGFTAPEPSPEDDGESG